MTCTGVTIPPKPVNAGLNETVSFTCTVIGEQIRWRVNRTTITPDLRSRGFDDSSSPVTLNATQHLQTSILTVFGSADNNGTNITCVAIFLISYISSDESEAALLLVFEPGASIDEICVGVHVCAYALCVCIIIFF